MVDSLKIGITPEICKQELKIYMTKNLFSDSNEIQILKIITKIGQIGYGFHL